MQSQSVQGSHSLSSLSQSIQASHSLLNAVTVCLRQSHSIKAVTVQSRQSQSIECSHSLFKAVAVYQGCHSPFKAVTVYWMQSLSIKAVTVYEGSQSINLVFRHTAARRTKTTIILFQCISSNLPQLGEMDTYNIKWIPITSNIQRCPYTNLVYYSGY